MVQVKTSTSEKLIKAFCEGFSSYIPFSSYESLMFMLKRIAGVNGYQHRVPPTIRQKQIFTAKEIKMLADEYEGRKGHEYRKYLTFHEKYLEIFNIKKHFETVLADEVSNLSVLELEESSNKNTCNRFKELSGWDKFRVNMQILLTNLAQFPVLGSILNAVFVLKIHIMRSDLGKLKKC
jgi:ribonucleotide reductase alpha subunit